MLQDSLVPKIVSIHLTCSKCTKYLSCLPVFINKEQKSFCSRCTNETEGLIRNEVYEIIARIQKFPCINDQRGCLDFMLPSKVLEHERYCKYAFHNCPNSECSWQGLISDLLDHFEDKHPTYILRNSQFELDFIRSQNERYLLPYCDELFIVKRETDAKKGEFHCTVMYLGCHPVCEDYICHLIIQNVNKSVSHTFKRKLAQSLDTNIAEMNELLKNPTAIIVQIDILDAVQQEEEVEDKVDRTVNDNMLSELECPVCMEYIVPPIYQCLGGHSLCKPCKESVKECPMCKKSFQETQNFVLEKMTKFLDYPCKHNKCRFVGKSNVIKQHEKNCVHGPFKCPLRDYENCLWQDSVQVLMKHIVEKHYENLLEIEKMTMPFEVNETFSDSCIVKHGTQLFQVHFLYKSDDQEFLWAVQIIGSEERCEKYKFEVDILDSSGNKLRFYFVGQCAPLCDKANAFDNGRKFNFVDYEQIKDLIGSEFGFRISVFLDK